MFVAGKRMDVSGWEDNSRTSASSANAHIRVLGSLPFNTLGYDLYQFRY